LLHPFCLPTTMTQRNINPQAPIGVFDSGVGGLSVLPALREALPNEDILFLGDQAHVPYGPRGLAEVRRLMEGVMRYFFAQGCKMVVIACNTASAAALHSLRADYPDFPIVGMEPAIKPAAEHTSSGVVGVLATPTTFEGELYASVVERFAQGVTVLQNTCVGLVGEIEAGRANGPEAERILRSALEPMLAQGLDTVVLGCTHYPFAFETIRAIVGPNVRLIDPAPAIARRAASLLDAAGMRNPREGAGNVIYYTTGDVDEMRKRVEELLGEQGDVRGLVWTNGDLGTN
jgi:glutamate racemase